jgi:chromate reductase, NAD(P)H dehydrogenase (quinone)
LRVFAISGSLRRDSLNTKLLRAAEELLPATTEVVFYEGLESVPPYNEDRDTDEAPLAAAELRDAITQADALVIATPEYNSSVPGQLKNAMDWASRPFRENALWGKPVVVIGASAGMYGAVWAQAELRKILAASGARVVGAEVAAGRAQTRFDQEGRLIDDELRDELQTALDALVAEAAPRLVAA